MQRQGQVYWLACNDQLTLSTCRFTSKVTKKWQREVQGKLDEMHKAVGKGPETLDHDALENLEKRIDAVDQKFNRVEAGMREILGLLKKNEETK